MSQGSVLQPIQLTPGCQPSTDRTNSSTTLSTFSDKIRWFQGFPQKIGGWVKQNFDYSPSLSGSATVINGVCRRIYSAFLNNENVLITLLGTNSNLYELTGSALVNITPLNTATIPTPNSISTIYDALVANPISTVANSPTVTVKMNSDIQAHAIGDTFALSGLTGPVGGIPAANLNIMSVIRSINTINNTFTFNTGYPATSTATGGGSAGYFASGLLVINQTAHGITDGGRVKLSKVGDQVAASAVVSSPGVGAVPTDTLTLVGGTYTTRSAFTVATTKVVQLSITNGGSGGANGTYNVNGTTGTGSKFVASVTVTGGSITSINSIAAAGSYTVNPTFLGAEPVTGSSLSGATFGVTMGVGTVNLAIAGQYDAAPVNPAATTSSGTDSGVTLNVTYSGTSSVGGIPNTLINQEFIARVPSANKFYVVIESVVATSAATAGGGSFSLYQRQLDNGAVNEGQAVGYGAGRYGVGLYGTALVSPTGRVAPRIWYVDRFQNAFILSPGNQGPVYTWNGDDTYAPTLLQNAPTAVNYVFVSNGIVVTFGYQGVGNQIFASDQNNPTIWNSSSTNQVFQDTIAGAGPLISHLEVNNKVLLFTDSRTYTFTYIGLPLVWDIGLLDVGIGIIAPLAGCVANGAAYWMGKKNFYTWSGGNVQVIPANSQTVSTILNYVFNNLTDSQRSKIYCWYNEQYSEVWWHYPSMSSAEPDRVARFNVNDGTWVPDTFDRTAAESPDILTGYPRLISKGSVFYQHESGNDADSLPMPFILTGNLKTYGKTTGLVEKIIPDSIQTGTVNLTITSQQYPQSTATTFVKTYPITPTTEYVQTIINGRYWQYTISGSDLGQEWAGGTWFEQVKQGAPV